MLWIEETWGYGNLRGGGKGLELRKMKDDTVEYHIFAELSKGGKVLRFPVRLVRALGVSVLRFASVT